MTYFRDIYDLDYELFEVEVPDDSELIGKTLDDVEHQDRMRVIASASGGALKYGPGAISRDTGITEGMVLGIIASPKTCSTSSTNTNSILHSSIEVLRRDPSRDQVRRCRGGHPAELQPGRQERA